MKKELIKELFEKFEQACYVLKDVECWSARELQEIFNYAEWRNFLKVIDKAREACKHSGVAVSDHFVETNKMVGVGEWIDERFGGCCLDAVCLLFGCSEWRRIET